MVAHSDLFQERCFSRGWIRQTRNTQKKPEQQGSQDNGYTSTLVRLLPVSFVRVQHIVLIA